MPVESSQHSSGNDIKSIPARLSKIRALVSSGSLQNKLSDEDLFREIQVLCDALSAEKEMRKQLHDMSNLLTVIVGRAELLAKTGKLQPEDKKDIEDIVAAGFNCCNLLEQARKIISKAA